MARASVYTRIPLDRAAAILGIDPLHFNGVVSSYRPELFACDDLWFQYASQREGQASREDLALALRAAEDKVFKELGYPLVPIWVRNEEHQLTHAYAVELVNPYGRNSRGLAKSVRSKLGYVIQGGIRAKSLIDDAAAVVYSDVDGDGYAETATVTVSTTVTDGQEIHVYYPGESGSDAWEIRPIRVTLSGGTATIKFRKELAPDVNLIEKYTHPGDNTLTINGDDNANFLATVDVYRVYNDPSVQATLYSEFESCNACGGSGCDYCEADSTTACLYVRNGKLGILAYTPGDWDAEEENFVSPENTISEPDKIVISYRAGLVNHDLTYPYLDMEPQWERAIVYYAISLLDREMSGCENTHNIWTYQNEDLAKSVSSQGSSVSYSINFTDMSNPFGTTRAALDLWRMVKRHRLRPTN